ncbi:MAG: T9SS type A sorting domain-containing protein, partial [Ignavibacteriaceae bacterium]
MKVIKYLTVLLLIFLCQDSLAQITIDGTVTDADLNPVNNALVEIIDENDSTNVYSANANEQGYFKISAITGIETNLRKVPQDYIILSNYPNPFNPTTAIYFELPKADNIKIVIYDILGREVRALYKAFHEAGSGQIIWDGRNNRNLPVAAGIYLCRLKTKEQSKVHKMVLLDGGSSSFSISNKRMLKSYFRKTSSINSIFNFKLRVTGNNILETEFRYLTCSKDTTVNLKVPSILQSATIGPEGGKLETEGFSLTIPQGAFSEDFTLKLAIATDSISVEEDKFSKLFRIDGLPLLYNGNLKLKIKLNKQPLDSISLAISRIDTLDLLGVEIYNYDYISASDSSGYALVTIPSSYNTNSLAKKELTISNTIDLRKYLIILASRGIVESSNGNFIIHYPKSKAQFIPDIDYYLEDAVDIIKSYGFKKLPLSSPETYTNWPVKVIFQTASQTYKKYGFTPVISFYFLKYKKYKSPKFEIIIISDSISYSSLNNLRRHLGRNVF